MEVIDISIEKKDRPNRSEVLEELGFDPEYKHVLNVGLWSSRKNQGEIVDIAKLMVNDKVMFHFIGNLSADFMDYWDKYMVDLPDSCFDHDFDYSDDVDSDAEWASDDDVAYWSEFVDEKEDDMEEQRMEERHGRLRQLVSCSTRVVQINNIFA